MADKPQYLVAGAGRLDAVFTEDKARAVAEYWSEENPGKEVSIYRFVLVASCQCAVQPLSWAEADAAAPTGPPGDRRL